MSTFVVEDRTINRVVSFLYDQGPDSIYHREIAKAFHYNLASHHGVVMLGQAMFQTNCQAVRTRYPDADSSGMIPDTFIGGFESPTKLEAYKALRCWLYQCNEGNIPETSPTFTVMKELSDQMSHDIVTALPEYDKLPWE